MCVDIRPRIMWAMRREGEPNPYGPVHIRGASVRLALRDEKIWGLSWCSKILMRWKHMKVREYVRARDLRHVVQGHDYTRPKVGAVCMKHTKGSEPPLVLTCVCL